MRNETTVYLATTVTDVGEEVADLLEGGVLVLYAEGAPPAVAEISVQHRTESAALEQAPPVGAWLTVGGVAARVSAVGPTAWKKVRELGHVVFNFNGAAKAERPGEICLDPCDTARLQAVLARGCAIHIADWGAGRPPSATAS